MRQSKLGPSGLLWPLQSPLVAGVVLEFSVVPPFRPLFSFLEHQEWPEVGDGGGGTH